MSETTSKKRKLSLPLIIAGGVSSLVLAMGMSPTFSAFTAAIQNTTNTAGAGTLTMEEVTTTGAVVTCDSGLGSATCGTINKFGGNVAMAPGQTVSTGITIKNTGSVAATTFTLLPSATCTASDVAAASVHGTGNPCTLMTVVIKSGTTGIYSGTLAGLASGGSITLPAVAAGAIVPFSFDVTLPASADNTMQGRQAAMGLTWTFGA